MNRRCEVQIIRVWDLICRSCAPQDEERGVIDGVVVPGDLVARVKVLLPEGRAGPLLEKGTSELPLAWLGAPPVSRVYVIDASRNQDTEWLVVCTGEDG
jgi:hypothetical protein